MQERHSNRSKYFSEQIYTTRQYVIPYIEKHLLLTPETSVLEIGCGEGGNLVPFMDLKCRVIGIDISPHKIELANDFLKDHPHRENLHLFCDDIYLRSDLGKFDLIILRDVIEHIPNQEMFMEYLKQFLKPSGIVFFGFPPWQNPYGGHQQICISKIFSILPYSHLLPVPIYKSLLHWFGEKNDTIQTLIEIKETGISIERFEKILNQQKYVLLSRTFFLVNPNYEVKFRLKPIKQFKIMGSIPVLRNFFTTAAYYLVALSTSGHNNVK